jgi:pimeloyl-ACP methyl ester carboxylesterase
VKVMANNRPKGVFGVGLACIDAAIHGRIEHRPTSSDYPETVIKRVTFTAGGGLGWRVSALRTVRSSRAPWKIVVITGAPSWAEYWAPVMAALPSDREMIVVDRPGFAASEPANCIPDIALQARALAPLLLADRGQKVILIGQSYGGAIATLMAEANPGRVAALVLLSLLALFHLLLATIKLLRGRGSLSRPLAWVCEHVQAVILCHALERGPSGPLGKWTVRGRLGPERYSLPCWHLNRNFIHNTRLIIIQIHRTATSTDIDREGVHLYQI